MLLAISNLHKRRNSHAFPVSNGCTGLVIFLTSDPHIFKGGETSKNGATNEDRVLAIFWRMNLNALTCGHQILQLLLKAQLVVAEHSGTAREDNIVVQICTDVDITLLDRIIEQAMDREHLLAIEFRLEKQLWATEKRLVHLNYLAIRQLVVLGELLRLLRLLQCAFVIQGHKAMLLLNVTYNFQFS